MKHIIILSLLFPLSLMAMEDQDLDGTLHIESRVHHFQGAVPDIRPSLPLPKPLTIIYPPIVDRFKYNKDKQCFVGHEGLNDWVELRTFYTSLLDFDHYSPKGRNNRNPGASYRFLATILSITKQEFRYQCAVEKYETGYQVGDRPDTAKEYEVSIPFPANDACTRCKLIFTDVEEQPTIIYPHTITLEEKQTTMKTLNPKLWINIKAEYVPKDGSSKYMTSNLTDTDIE